MAAVQLRSLPPISITPQTFAPFGQVIFPSEDGMPFGPEDAQLVLDRGIPRFYIMQLHNRGLTFKTITRHNKCTQCLGSLASKEWLMGVAPPSPEQPDPTQIQAFKIPGNCFIKLNLGTWHAGPFFEYKSVDFYNLELSNTNVSDRETVDLNTTFGLEYEIHP